MQAEAKREEGTGDMPCPSSLRCYGGSEESQDGHDHEGLVERSAQARLHNGEPVKLRGTALRARLCGKYSGWGV